MTKQETIPTHPAFVGHGLTKREYFAALAMQAQISNADNTKTLMAEQWLEEPERIARWAVNYADALITQLNKP
jgi:hypothetical protein